MSAGDGSCGSDACGCSSGTPPSSADEAGASLVDQLDNESGFHPMGEEWEEEMRAMLEDTDYDADLGMDMARDAMRLVAGEMEEEEYYEKYHEAVVHEFDEDDRPMAADFADMEDPEDGSVLDSLKDLADQDVSRRDTMKKGAFAAGALGLGGVLPNDEQADNQELHSSTAAAQSDDEDGKRYGMVIDLDRCDGCLECVVGCMDENRTSSGANWMYVLTWEDETTEQENFLVRPCQHCSNAPCAKVCPVQARHIREEDGLVLTNYETCIGCRYCQVACPYGVNYFEWGEPEIPQDEIHSVDYTGPELRDMSRSERQDILQGSEDHLFDARGWEVDSRGPVGTMGKCTFCPSRQDGHVTPEHLEQKGLEDQAELHEGRDDLVGTVACMDSCDVQGMSAIHFGDLNDPDSRPNRYLEQRKEIEPSPEEKNEAIEDPEHWEDPTAPHHTSQLSAFRLLEEMGTEPNVVYLGNEPGPNAKQSDDPPVDYDRITSRLDDDDRQVVDRRKDVTDEWTDFGAWGAD